MQGLIYIHNLRQTAEAQLAVLQASATEAASAEAGLP
jgi:hypothetical protein